MIRVRVSVRSRVALPQYPFNLILILPKKTDPHRAVKRMTSDYAATSNHLSLAMSSTLRPSAVRRIVDSLAQCSNARCSVVGQRTKTT